MKHNEPDPDYEPSPEKKSSKYQKVIQPFSLHGWTKSWNTYII